LHDSCFLPMSAWQPISRNNMPARPLACIPGEWAANCAGEHAPASPLGC
jgi:hypothetical protein